MTAGKASRTNRGITLIELLVALAVLAVLATIGVPSFQNLMRSNQVATQSNELIAMMTLARSEAIRRGRDVELVLEAGNGAGWEARMQIRDNDGQVEILRAIAHRNTALSQSLAVAFNNRGYLEPFKNVSFSLEHAQCSSGKHRRVYTLDRTGRNAFDQDFPDCAATQ